MLNDLTAEDYNNLIHYFKPQTHRLCYYSLSSLIVWSHHLSKPVWKIEDDALITGMVFFSKPADNYLLLPIAKGKQFSPAQLLRVATKNGFNKYQFIPEDYVTGDNYVDIKNIFDIVEQPKAEDYIFRTEDLAELKGKKYSKKRNLINQFKNTYLKNNNIETAPLTFRDVPECLMLLNTWAEAKTYDIDSNSNAACEKKVAENALNNIDKLGFSGLQLRIDGAIKAFGIASKLTDDIGGFNFEKADSDIKGLYQYFDQQCALQLFSDVPYINKECDMGDPGLRQAKRSYYPDSTVKSFQLIIK